MASNNQDMATPPEFVRAVEKYFRITFKYDMAASAKNAKCKNYFTIKDDSLKINWPLDGWCWLNPEFRNLTAWIKKCKEQKDRGCKAFSIWPLSSDKNQIVSWTGAEIYVIHGRIWPHVRGIMLCKWKLNQSQLISGLIWDRKKLTRKWQVGRKSRFRRAARLAILALSWIGAWAWTWTGCRTASAFEADLKACSRLAHLPPTLPPNAARR